jgi:hypothetical protein
MGRYSTIKSHNISCIENDNLYHRGSFPITYKNLFVLVISLAYLFLNTASSSAAQLPAFPEAEGFGAISAGGRGGEIIEVTNLNNDGPGSLRNACDAQGPRIIIFRVAGQIELVQPIKIKSS